MNIAGFAWLISVFQIQIHWFRIRIHYFRLNADPDPIRIQGLMKKNFTKFKAENFYIFFWSKIAIYLSIGLHKGRPSYRRSLQSSKENIQHFKTWNILWVILPSWINIRIWISNPDPLTWLNPDPIRIVRIQNIGWMCRRPAGCANAADPEVPPPLAGAATEHAADSRGISHHSPGECCCCMINGYFTFSLSVVWSFPRRCCGSGMIYSWSVSLHRCRLRYDPTYDPSEKITCT
jgi:hypothetical protein